MTPSISVGGDTKRQWDERKPSDYTHDEFAQHALDCVARDEGEVVNIDDMVEEINHRIATEVELAAYRGVREALE
jgi:hypothetical protein